MRIDSREMDFLKSNIAQCEIWGHTRLFALQKDLFGYERQMARASYKNKIRQNYTY